MMPIKIPMKYEPVIPYNVNEIIVVMGLESIGREVGAVCQHYKELEKFNLKLNNKTIDYKYIVTNELIDEITNYFYIDKLKKEYKNTKISVIKIDFTKSENYKNINKIALVLCASGVSKRFGNENKLIVKLNDGKELYKLMIEKLIDAKDNLINNFENKLSYNKLKVDIAIVSQYDEILTDKEYEKSIIMLKNENYNSGLSSSIKIGIKNFYEYDAISFFNADTPKLPSNEISMFLYNSICVNSKIASMYTNFERNPAYIENEYFKEALEIENDNGLKVLLDKYKMNTYKYFINEDYLYDIDTKEDLIKYCEDIKRKISIS